MTQWDGHETMQLLRRLVGQKSIIFSLYFHHVFPEEVETLLEVPLQPHEYVDVNLKTAVYDSIKKHLIIPVTRGR